MNTHKHVSIIDAVDSILWTLSHSEKSYEECKEPLDQLRRELDARAWNYQARKRNG